jgi:hypothetical protein
MGESDMERGAVAKISNHCHLKNQQFAQDNPLYA